MYESVLNQLRDAGLIVETLETDTKAIVRCKVEGDTGKKRSGWYRVYSVISKAGNTYYVGSYGNWKNSGLPEKGVAIEYDGSALSEDDRAAIVKKQKEAQRAADRERKAKNSEAATRAVGIWSKLRAGGSAEYLTRKKVAGFGVRYSRGAVVVPVCTVGGELVGLQFIYADSGKKFLTGTAKSGAFHLVGSLEPSEVVVIAEGYATAASIHMATRVPTVVAFDAGNLVKVGEAIRKAYPDKTLIVAADNDDAGKKYAGMVARKVGAVVWLPEFPEGQAVATGSKLTDFNDLHVLSGLEAVACQYQSVKNQLEQAPAADLKSGKAVAAPPPPPDDTTPASGYLLLKSGVYWIDPNGEEGVNRYRVCGRLEVLSMARAEDGRGWGLMLSFTNLDGQECEWFVPNRLFAAERGSKVVEGLLDMGLDIDPFRKSRERLMDYLQRAKPDKRVRLVGKRGWHGNAFVSPVRVVGNPAEPLHYYSDRKPLNRAAVAGSLEGWQENIASYCRGNPVLMFTTSAPFAGPLLEWLGMKTVGFHVVGPSSLGKSSITAVAGSVCGGDDYYRTWNTTAAALEPTAAEHSDSILILDEINQADPFTVGQTVYQLGNEEGRARATDTGSGTRVQHSWRLIWLSNGERSLRDIQSRAGKVTEAGMEMRLLHIKADLHPSQKERDSKGIYQELHGFAHGAALSEHLKRQVALNHGHAFLAFVEWLASADDDGRKKLVAYLHRKIEDFQHQHLSERASGQARRAAMGFALVGMAGELATSKGITGWKKGEAEEAAALLFKNFLEDRGGEGNAEDRAILEQICLELQTKGESHWTRWDKEEATVDTHQPRSMTRWGFRKIEENHNFGTASYSEEVFYTYKEVFRKELCRGFSYRRACELLKEHGALESHAGKGFMYNARLPGSGEKPVGVYCIRMSALRELMPDPGDNIPTSTEVAGGQVA